MKKRLKKILTITVIIILLFVLSLVIPVTQGEEWVNDDKISDVGHYEKYHYNIYGFPLKY